MYVESSNNYTMHVCFLEATDITLNVSFKNMDVCLKNTFIILNTIHIGHCKEAFIDCV